MMLADFSRRLALKELLGLSNPVERFTALTSLRQRPSRGGDRPWKK